MSSIRRVLLLLIFVDSGLHAHEIRYIDFPFAEQRTELRHPRGDCKEGMLCGGTVGGCVSTLAARRPDTRTIGYSFFVCFPTLPHTFTPLAAKFTLLFTARHFLPLPRFC